MWAGRDFRKFFQFKKNVFELNSIFIFFYYNWNSKNAILNDMERTDVIYGFGIFQITLKVILCKKLIKINFFTIFFLFFDTYSSSNSSWLLMGLLILKRCVIFFGRVQSFMLYSSNKKNALPKSFKSLQFFTFHFNY